jgi:hypothetical protein
VPYEDVTAVPGDTEPPSDSQWVATPQPGEAVEIRVYLAKPRMGGVDLTPLLRSGARAVDFVNGFRVANGEVVLLFSATGALDRDLSEELEEHRAYARQNVPPSFDLSPASGPRALTVEVVPDGHRDFWDLSLA